MSALPPGAWPFPVGSKPAATPTSNVTIKGGANYAAGKGRGHGSKNRWDKKSLATFAEMYVAGNTDSDIAQELGRTVKAIANQLMDAGRRGNRGVVTDTGKKLAKLIEEAEAARAKAAKPVNHKAAWDTVADNQLLVAYTKGGTVETVAAECGRTVASVAGRLRELGVLEFKRVQRADGDFDIIWTVPARVWYQTVVKA